MVLWSLAALVVLAGVGLLYLAVPGTPANGKNLVFKGFIPLPPGKLLTVLDYLSVYDGSLFVTDMTAGSVHKIPLGDGGLPNGAHISTFTLGPATHGVIIDPVSRRGYVTRSGANTVDIFDPIAMKLIKRLPVADDPDGIVYDPRNKLVYVANGEAGIATLIDPAAGTTVGTVPLGGKPEFAAFDSQTGLMYQNLQDVNAIAAVDPVKRAVVGRWPLEKCEGPSGMAIDQAHRRLFVECMGSGKLMVLDIDTKRIVEQLPIGGGPDSVVYDEGLRRLYATGTAGRLVVVQQETPDTYRVIDSITLHFGAHTLTVDPATHFLYLGYTTLIAQPRIAVFSPTSPR
jgi:YVTN family beta-propeller protein